MVEKHLHIINLTVPYPADYGGVIDLFWKLPALQAQGVKIHLHCFDYGRGPQPELEKYCVSVNYYKRQTGHKAFSTTLPYIVASRKNEELMQNLLKDDYPIFMEGVHCSYILNDERFNHRKKFVRLHNVEHHYYKHLAQTNTSFAKKIFYQRESNLLKKYELSMFQKATAFWSVTEKDRDYFKAKTNCNNLDYLPLYLPNNWSVNIQPGKGTYCLYHGDLSVEANEEAAIWLLEKVFSVIEVPFVIAGKKPNKRLEKLAHSFNHTCIVANPSEKEMQDMIAKAQINILPSCSNTGIKLKFLNALFNGKHCIVNNNTVEGTNLHHLCTVANTVEELQASILDLFNQPFTTAAITARHQSLTAMFNNEKNAAQQVKWIWEDYA